MNTEDIKRMTRAYQAVIEKKLDPVNHSALKKDFKDREDKDIDNDGDIDKSDEYLHKRRKAVSKAVKGETATTNPKMKTSGASEQKEETEVEENYNWKVSHAGKHVYVKAPHAGVAVKKAQKGYGNMDLTKAKVKNLGKVGMPANEAVSTADKKPENYMEADGKMHTRMAPTKKDVVKKEGTIRDRLMSVLEKRDEHYKSATAPEPIDSKDSPNAKKMRKDHKPEVMADINKVSDDVAKATKSAKTSPKRPNDNTQGDKNIINPAQDVTKQGGFKESVMNIWNAYKSVVEKK
jgi:hypothetical protein